MMDMLVAGIASWHWAPLQFLRCNLSMQVLLSVVQQEILGPLLYSSEEYKRESYSLNVPHLTNILQCCNFATFFTFQHLTP